MAVKCTNHFGLYKTVLLLLAAANVASNCGEFLKQELGINVLHTHRLKGMHQPCVQLYLKKAIKGEIVINLKGKRICGTKSTFHFQSERKCLTGALESHGASNCIIPPIKANISLQSWTQAYRPSSTLTVESSTAYRYIYDINYVCEYKQAYFVYHHIHILSDL